MARASALWLEGSNDPSADFIQGGHGVYLDLNCLSLHHLSAGPLLESISRSWVNLDFLSFLMLFFIFL